MLLMPRAGSTFCERVITRTMPTAMMHATPAIWATIGGFTKHNYRGEMPLEYKFHQVVGVKRNVLDLWASWYFYEMWDEMFDNNVPWPGNVSFEEYYRTVENTGRKLVRASSASGFARDFYEAMFGNVGDVRFLDFSSLNLEVYRLLKEYGHEDKRILAEPPMNADTCRNGRHWDSVISKDMAELILESEKGGILNGIGSE